MKRQLFVPDDVGIPMETLLGCPVIPRPIAWVATRSADDVDNLVSYSYFTISALDPPVVQFTSIGRRDSDQPLKDSVRNILETKEFVICFVQESLMDAANATTTAFPPRISEFDAVGLTREPSTVVRPPQVAESVSAIECGFYDTKRISHDIVVFGEVVCVAVDQEVLRDGFPDPRLLDPASRLGHGHWSSLGPIGPHRVPPYVEE